MILYYSLLLLMLLVAICLLAIPFFKDKALSSKKFVAVTAFLILFSSSAYFLPSHQSELKQWLTSGYIHYQLLMEFNKLGGLDGMIAKIKIKLENNPQDTQGWMILGKLYQMKGDKTQAKAAFKKAQSIKTPSIIQNNS